MKTYMPLNGLRWSRNSGSANCDMPQSAVFGRPGGWVFSRFLQSLVTISLVQNLSCFVVARYYYVETL